MKNLSSSKLEGDTAYVLCHRGSMLKTKNKNKQKAPYKNEKRKKKTATKIMAWVTAIKKMGFIYKRIMRT